MDAEKRLVACLLAGFKGAGDKQEYTARLKAVLGEQATLVDESGDVGDPEWDAWQELKNSSEGKSLLAAARYRIALKDRREAAAWAAWLASEKQFSGRGSFIEASSPVEGAEWKWPLTIAVMEDRGYTAAAAALSSQIEHGPSWMKVLVRQVQTPAEEAGVADILIFPEGLATRETLLEAGALVTADLLVLFGVPRNRFGHVAVDAEELLRLTQANAILAADINSRDTTLLTAIIEELAHDHPLDVAVGQALRFRSLDPGLVLLLSNPRFIEEARLSRFVEHLSERLRQVPDHLVEAKGILSWTGLPDPTPAKALLPYLKDAIRFDRESMGASEVSTIASSAPPPPDSTETKAKREPGAKGPSAKARYLLERLLALEPTGIDPEEALEATKRYALEVHVAPKHAGYFAGKTPLPEPPVRQEESAVSLLVVFFEKNSKPDAESRTIKLPRTGESSRCEFEFTVSGAADVFEGYISVYHNNRLLQEGVLRTRVEGGAAQGGQVPNCTAFIIRRPLALGLENRTLYGGTLRLEGDGTMMGVRGLQAARVNLQGLKDAQDSLAREFNRIEWSDLGAGWVNDKGAAEHLSIIAQQGWQLHRRLCDNPLVKKILESDKPVLVYAADANVRAPVELCYSKTQPKFTASVCRQAAVAVAQGSCVKDCEGQKDPQNHVCPMGFWGLSKVIEWRSREADSRDDPAVIEITNEPGPKRRSLTPLDRVLVARSGRVTGASMQQLERVLGLKASSWREVKSWDAWEAAVGAERPTLLLLMPHVDNSQKPPLIEVQLARKDPPGIEVSDVVGYPPQRPVVLLLGCGSATASVDFMSLPAQFRRNQAAVVVALLAEVLADEAPEIARAIIETLGDSHGTRPFGQVLLSAKRKLVAEGKLAGILLLAFGDADWLV